MTITFPQHPGYWLEEPDGHGVELWHDDHQVAVFVSRAVTLGEIEDAVAEHMLQGVVGDTK